MAEEQILDLLMSPEAGAKALDFAVSEVVTRRLSVSRDSACFLAHRQGVISIDFTWPHLQVTPSWCVYDMHILASTNSAG